MIHGDIEKAIEDCDRRLTQVESTLASHLESAAAMRSLMSHMSETINQVSGRVTAVRDMVSDYEHRVIEALKEHERREEAKWEDDHRYRETREHEDRKQRITSVFSLLSILATLGAVLLAWFLGSSV